MRRQFNPNLMLTSALLTSALLSIFAFVPSASAAPGTAGEAATESLERRLAEQERATQQLRAEVEELREAQRSREAAAAELAKLDPLTASSPERIKLGRFYIASQDEAYKILFSGRIQLDFLGHAERGRTAFDNRFDVRRGRFELELTFAEIVHADFGMEFGRTGDADFRNAFVELRFDKAFQLRMGQMLLPFGDVRLISSNYMVHPERPVLAATIVAQRDIGVMAHGKVLGGLVEYAVGAFNGAGQNTKTDTNDDFDVAARLVLQPIDMVAVSFNGIVTPTDRDAARGPEDLATVGGTLFRFLDYDDANRRLGRRYRLGSGLKLMHENIDLLAEINFDYHRKVESAAGVRSNLLGIGWHVDAQWVVTGETLKQGSSGAKVTPASPIYDPETGEYGSGAFSVAARYEEAIADSDAISRGFATGARRLRAGTFTGQWYLLENVRVTASYTYSAFSDRVTDASGRQHNDEHSVLLRLGLFF